MTDHPSPRLRVVVHVGAPKTGTTYLQERLAANVRRLAEHQVVYPVPDRGDHFGAALALIEEDWGGQGAEVRGEWDALVKDVADARDGSVVVISHELLAGATRQQTTRAVAQLEAAGCRGEERNEVHVVYAVRDLARQIPAEWQEGVKHRRKRSFRGFTRRIAKARKGPRATMWFWRAQDPRGVLTRWGAAVPNRRLHVVTVPPAGADPDELYRRYCRAFGIDPAWAPEPAAGENTSIGTAETAMLRALNKRLKKVDFPNDAYRVLVRQLVVHQTLAQRRGTTRASIGDDVRAWAAPLADEWIAWIGQRAIEVVGDLEDLRVAATEPAQDGSGPRVRAVDDPKKGDVADAALDALVAVLQHASRHDPVVHPEPESAPRTLARRVVRRAREVGR